MGSVVNANPHERHLLNQLNLELIKLDPEVIYNEESFTHFLSAHCHHEGIKEVDEIYETSPYVRGSKRRNSDPSPTNPYAKFD